MAKRKRTKGKTTHGQRKNNNLQNITQEIKDWAIRTPLKKPIQLILHASITDKHYNLLFIKLTLNQHDF